MLDFAFSILLNGKSDIKVYQLLKGSLDSELSSEQGNDICHECENDHSFKGNPVKTRTSFDIFQEIIDEYDKEQQLKKIKQVEQNV